MRLQAQPSRSSPTTRPPRHPLPASPPSPAIAPVKVAPTAARSVRPEQTTASRSSLTPKARSTPTSRRRPRVARATAQLSALTNNSFSPSPTLSSPQTQPPCCAVVRPYASASVLSAVATGDLGHYAVLFRAALGAEVIAIFPSSSKREHASKMGAKAFCFTAEDPKWAEKLAKNPLDLIVSTASSRSRPGADSQHPQGARASGLRLLTLTLPPVSKSSVKLSTPYSFLRPHSFASLFPFFSDDPAVLLRI
ncbi:hypothetical protein V8E36_003864 [Tilletia maclaganii]